MNQWRSQPKNLGEAKVYGSRQITLFYLEKRLSKHKITIFTKIFLGEWLLWPPQATPMRWMTHFIKKCFKRILN